MLAEDVVARAIAGERRWLARAITLIEQRAGGVTAALSQVKVRRRRGPGAPHVVGVTGPPGAGKSTFVDGLVTFARTEGRRVAVIAVDPSSPFSGGAILGDRIRMEHHAADDGVFIRSLSSRGHLGGLSGATSEIVDLLDACGFDLVLVETVGVGQSELAVIEVADTAVVVLTPESGDTVQTMKAGLLEIADVFVVNKDDRPGAPALVRALESMIELDGVSSWRVPVCSACARDRRGVDEVAAVAARHLAWCLGEGRDNWQRRRGDGRVRRALDRVAEVARAAAWAKLGSDSAALEAVRTGEVGPDALVGPS